MKKRILSLLLALVMTASMLPAFSAAAGNYSAEPTTSDYFYNQLNDRAKAIYKKLLDEFTGTDTKAQYYDGKQVIDLIGVEYISGPNVNKPIISQTDINNYKNGNKDIFNDFCAAKDALDLDHSELWYIDSGYLTFRVTHSSAEPELTTGYHVLIGPGRGETYLLGGLPAKDIALSGKTIESMDEEINNTIDEMVDEALSALDVADSKNTYSKPDQLAFLATNIHDQITKGIHYRYEIECNKTEDAKFIRTIYGMQTHEGVCEAYARTLQVCLTRLGIESVLVHGVQTKGTPEDHMWNAVNIPDADEQETPRWYVIDATWDDPLTATYTGERDLTFKNGEDGKETNTYLLVGQSLVGEHWRPSGYVSTGNFEFKYPTIETAAYSGATVINNSNGLKIDYSAGSAEEGVPAGVFSVTYQGMDAHTASQKGLYFMVKMYDYHPDGTADVMDEWYYADATFIFSEGNPYFGDYGGALRICTPTCEYVEIAVTTREPDHRQEWDSSGYSYISTHPEAGYFHGDESEIIAQSGMLYNVNSKYEAPPYVLTQFPAPNGNCTAGYDYRFDVVFDDDLKHPQASQPATIDAFADDTQLAANQTVRVRYTTIQQDLHTGGEKYVQIAGELPFDKDRDGYVDMDAAQNSEVNFKWKYKYDGKWSECPNHDKHKNNQCDVNEGCAIVGVEFNFRASDQWIDDITEYNFSIEGVVGSRSNKFPNNFSVISCIPGLCPACYRSQGIDWNLWGQPTLLDAPENLDLYNMAKEGGTDKATLDKLNEEMNRDDLNGRLMLVVEDKSKGAGNREDYERINDALPQDEKDAIAKADEVISSVFEINFNRICPMVKLKPNKNQSLRVQVGYPAGITYETLANYDLKAYHFTRCSNDEGYYCDEVKAALAQASDADKADILKNHKWGEHIISTEQIEIVPTPYGMVIMCSAFSPFEIVGVKKSSTAASAIAETMHNVVVVSGENGKVKIGDNYAVGANGNQKIPNGGSLTFTVEPASGYVVDTVSFGGTTVNATGNNTYKLEDVQKSDVLNVTFIPDSVHEADEVAGYATVVAEVCTHTTTHTVEDGKEAKNPTCTEPGYAYAVVCSTCGQTITPAHEIPATGHTPATESDGSNYYIAGTPASCTTGGKNAYVKCTTPGCNAVLSDGKDTSPLGHIFTNYTEGARDCRGVTLTATCDRDGCNFIDTKVNPDGRVDHKYTKYTVTTPATCTANAIETASCDFGCGSKATREVQNTATGHTPKTDGSGVCAKCEAYICASNHHNYQPTEKVPATCTEAGHEAGRQCTVCGHWEVREKTIPALGHDFAGHTAGTKCSRCDTVMKNDNHTFVDMPQKAATCDDEGSTGGKWCSECHYIDPANKPTITPALGHSWNTNSPEWHWSTDGEPSAAVTLTCTRDGSHKETFEAELKLATTTTAATCKNTGVAKYTATVTVEGTQTTLTDTNDHVVVPMTAHTPSSTPVETPVTCAHHGTRTYTCSVCNQEIVETIEGELLPHEFIAEPTKSTAPTCTQAGKNVSICAVCREEKEETVPALGHNYVNGVCTRCGATNTSYTAPTVPSGSTGGSRTETVTGSDGSKTTTVTASDGSKTTTTTTADGVVGTTKTDADGNVTSVDVIMPYGSETGEAVVAPVKVKASVFSENAPEIGITVREGSARVEIPVENVNHGTVAVIVDEDGNETVIRDCAVDENGVIITVDGSVTVKIVDRSVDFTDVQTTGHWASDAVEFVAARSLFNGTGEGVFSPETAMERGMLVTVLHRLAYEPEADSTQITFGDIQSSDYFAEASAWANANHIVEGYNGSFHPRDDVSREDLVTILYRYAKFRGYATETSDNALTTFTDVQNVKSYAVEAMNWAVSVGLVNGVTADRLAPQAGAKRAEVATIIERFCKNVVK